MKKGLFILPFCLLFLLTACSLFPTYPSVDDCIYSFESATYESGPLTTAEKRQVDQLLAEYRSENAGMVIAFYREGRAVYTKDGATKYDCPYRQTDAHVLVTDGPYTNTNMNGTVYCGYTVNETDNQTLALTHQLLLPSNTTVTFKLIYTLTGTVSAEDESIIG